jgi:hypothetical protein
MLAKFWWGTDERQRKVHWLSWENLGKNKNKGGMGFRGFDEFNQALLENNAGELFRIKIH